MFYDTHTGPDNLPPASGFRESPGRFEKAAEAAAMGREPGPASSKETQGRFLKNPLPVPERRPHIRMEFDLLDDWDIPEEEEHFDLEIPEDDDFDL